MGTSTLNPSSLSINDNTSNSTTITSTSINTNVINAKSLSIMNSINIPIYTLPTTSGTTGQVLAVQNGTTQLGWQNVNSVPSTITTPATFYFGSTMSGTGYTTDITINKIGNIAVLSIATDGLTGLINNTGVSQNNFQCEVNGLNSIFIPSVGGVCMTGIQVNQMLPSGMIQSIVECDIEVATSGSPTNSLLIKFITRFAYNIGWYVFSNGLTFDLSRQYYNSGVNDYKFRAPLYLCYQTNN
jgi:hypothetical protein